jgi:hypothetical protein
VLKGFVTDIDGTCHKEAQLLQGGRRRGRATGRRHIRVAPATVAAAIPCLLLAGWSAIICRLRQVSGEARCTIRREPTEVTCPRALTRIAENCTVLVGTENRQNRQ